MRIDRVSLSTDGNPMFWGFWRIAVRHYPGLGIEPHLAYVGSGDDDAYAEVMRHMPENVTLYEKVPGHGTWQVPWAIFHNTRNWDPDTVVLTMGIDEFPISTTLLDMAKPPYSVLVTISDRWHEATEEEIASFPSQRDTPWFNLPTAYHVATVRAMREVYDFHDSWQLELDRIAGWDLWQYDRPDIGHGWGWDESWATRRLRDHRQRGGLLDADTDFTWFLKHKDQLEAHYRHMHPSTITELPELI